MKNIRQDLRKYTQDYPIEFVEEMGKPINKEIQADLIRRKIISNNKGIVADKLVDADIYSLIDSSCHFGENLTRIKDQLPCHLEDPYDENTIAADVERWENEVDRYQKLHRMEDKELISQPSNF